MADAKTIDQLPNKSSLTGSDMLPVDDGVQSYKVLFSNLLAAIPGITGAVLSQDGTSIVVTYRDGTTVTLRTSDPAKQDTLTFDQAPAAGSSNPVTSDGIAGALASKQDTLTLDNTPTENSDNPVKSGGVYTALDGKQDVLTFDQTPTENSTNPVTSGGVKAALTTKQDALTFDNVPTENSNNPVKSGGVYSALSSKQDTLTFDQAPAAGSSNPVTSDGIRKELDDIIGDIETIRLAIGSVKIYGVKWSGATHQMERLFDAAGITTSTENFVYKGTVNANYSNPFDAIYPWSETRQCNVDLAEYAALSPGDDIRDAVLAWYGDPDFKTDGSNGFVGRYTPEFWYTAYEAEDGRVFCVADKEITGWRHHKPSIRSHGFAVDDGNGGVTSNDGQPLTNIAVSTIHARAKSIGAALQSIYDIDAQTILAIVEYASYDAQRAMGDGCSAGYYKCTVTVPSAEAGATTVLLPKAAKPYCIAGATLDFGTSQDSVVIANRRTVVSAEDYDATYCRVEFAPSFDLTASMYASIHGKNNADSFGNKSGYLGVNGKNNAWYRGAIMWGNRLQYTLGMARKTGTNTVWLCPEELCNDHDGLDDTVFKDTGIKTPTVKSSSWRAIGTLDYPEGLSAIGVVKDTGSVVGDSQYCVTESTGNTTPFFGGGANSGGLCGFLYAHWTYSPGTSDWTNSGVILLESP